MTKSIHLLLLGVVVVSLIACQSRPIAPAPTPCATPADANAPLSCGPSASSSIPAVSQTLSSQITTPLGSITYAITETLRVVNDGPRSPDKQNLWVALISDVEPHQRVKAMSISPAAYTLVSDEYGNRYAEFDFSHQSPGETISVTIAYQVTVSEVAADLTSCSGPLPTEFTQPELHIESSNPQITALASELARGQATACDQVRAFYDYIGNHLVYSYNGRSWGAQAALGEMGADCTEYSDLLIALSRAAGIPARYVEGLAYFPNTTNALARTEHAWVEVYLPGPGWTPIDPTLGRSSLTRATYFAHLPPDHILVTRGRNPSTLRGASYFTHLYWPGKSADIRIEGFGWEVKPIRP